MTEKGKVLEINGTEVTLGFCENEACKSCGGHLCNVKEKHYTAENKKGIPLRRGDVVEVFIDPGKTVLASFMLLIVPLLLFFLFYLLGNRFMEAEIANVGLGTLGLAGGFGLNLLIARKRKGKEELPRIVRVLEEE